MALSLAEMRKRAQEEEERKNDKSKSKTKFKGDGASFPVGEIPDNTTTIFRFLPDGNTENPWFWQERQVCKLTFNGQVGGEYATDEPVEVTVPCMDMWEQPGKASICPVIMGTRHLWKDEDDTAAIDIASQYYKKRSYLYQGFVVSTAVEEEEIPENLIRRLTIYPSIHKIIKGVMTDTEIEDSPVDYLLGRDFRIIKEKKPSDKWAQYGTSKWSGKVRPLSEEENIAIQRFNLYNLSDFLGPKPDSDGVALIKAMFNDSIAGKPFDYESYGTSYRAYKIRGGERRADADAISHVEKSAPQARNVDREEQEVKKPATPSSDEGPSKISSDDFLKRLKEKHSKKV